ncbi:M57 family metalloprotease [Aquimarina pacifica]|uniref:M57 family metalloprotease n=1 Tax=Aquimarina pacifica TaxID=1296415 RepID=UPI000472C915|nr:M57 family metalloprotease [Aquimarina pacifica]
MKKNIFLPKPLFLIIVTLFFSCESDETTVDNPEEVIKEQIVPESIITKLKQAGFNTNHEILPYENGYIVEKDIFLTEKQIDILANEPEEKQYHTTELVDVPHLYTRTIKVYFAPDFNQDMQNAFEDALTRFNNLNLNLIFERTEDENNNDIKITGANMGTIFGISGYPENGDPYQRIKLNTKYYTDYNTFDNATTVIAHEIGHAIGFRHTDFKNTSYSCGGDPYDEGRGLEGGIHIDGTPTGGDSESWMLTCLDFNHDRPFTNNDITALTTLYPRSELNAITGEYRAEPGSVIQVKFKGTLGAWCSTREKLTVTIYGANLSDPTRSITWTSWASDSFSFVMPASGVVHVKARMNVLVSNHTGCSLGSVKFNNTNEIQLGTGGFGKTSFPF